MKKLLSPIIFIFLATFLFSSCSNVTNLTIAKRHYRHGFFIDFGGKRTIPVAPVVARKHVLPANETTPVITANIAKSIDTKPAAIVSQKLAASQKLTVAKKGDHKTTEQTINVNPAGENILTSQTIASNNTIAGDSAHNSRGSNNGVPFWLVVVCAILLPPLGVYFAYGIGTYFWIDLILTLLFFFPGMIFALIMVLQK